MDVTAKIAQFVINTKYETIPPKALATAKTAVLDCLGVTLAGSQDRCATFNNVSEHWWIGPDRFTRTFVAIFRCVFQFFESAAAIQIEEKRQIRLAGEYKRRRAGIVVEMLISHAVGADRQYQQIFSVPIMSDTVDHGVSLPARKEEYLVAWMFLRAAAAARRDALQIGRKIA